jgi:hypothetical protein
MLDVGRSIALALLLASVTGCEEHEPSEDAQVGISPASVRWTLDWELEGTSANGSEGFEVVNDLGYRVRVEAGWIGSWGATLVECADEGMNREQVVELGVASPWLIAEGHASGDDDPSAWVFAVVESLTEQRIVGADPIELPAARYCEVHYLIAPISEASEGFAEAAAALAQVDAEASLVDASVVIVGSWEPPGGGPATPFVLRSEQSYGKILALDPSAVDQDGVDVEVVVRRELASMFDQVEFASAEPEAAAWQAVGNLAKLASARAQLPRE